jgi:flagellar basal-body rod modification protein FlgD
MQITASTSAGAAGANASTAGANASAAKSRIGLADDFDSFLQLLTTQLKHQDPLSPMDANQFTQQLVQFSSVEQAIKTNDVLGQLLSLVRSDQIGRSLDYLGAEVEAAGQTLRLDGTTPAQVSYHLDQPASAVLISIYDEAGRLVATRQGEGETGNHSITWDGRDQSGQPVTQGLYRVDVAAKNAAGQPITAGTSLRGTVEGVELMDGKIFLSVDGVLLPLDSVTSIRRPPTGA